MVHPLIDHRNEATKCSKLCSQTTRQFHLSFEHFMMSFLWSIRVYTMENCGRRSVYQQRVHLMLLSDKSCANNFFNDITVYKLRIKKARG